jgi:Uma2 family endonuclease
MSTAPVPMSPTGGEHGSATKRLDHHLTSHIYANGLGECFAAETGFLVARNPDTTLAPDWAFIECERLPDPIPRGFVPVVPAMVVQTRSPGDMAAAVAAKIRRWLEAGVRVVLDHGPAAREITIHRAGSPAQRLGTEDLLSLPDLLTGFSVPVRQLFPGGQTDDAPRKAGDR